jgi:hypothetical protein
MNAKDYVKDLHGPNDGFITIAKNQKTWKQQYFNDINKINIRLNTKDTYVSQNSFINQSRRLINLNRLHSIYIDIDCYTKNLTKEAVIFFLEEMYGEIPRPNYLVDSGRGVYYIILIDENKKKLPEWQVIEKFLFSKMEWLGADAKCLDATRVLRVVDSVNSRNNQRVTILDHYDYNYSIDEILENYIPEIPKAKKAKKKKKGRPRKIVSLYNLYTLYHSRIEDIETLCRIRNYNMTGYRETTLFLYRYFSNVYHDDEDEALYNALELNKKFTEPLNEIELIEDTESASRYYKDLKYKYSNAKLIKLLDITEEEQKQLSTIISTKEKYRRNNLRRYKERRNDEGKTEKEIEIEKRKESVRELKQKKYTNKEIAKKLGITERTVKRYL